MKEKINLFMKELKKMPDFDKVDFVFLYGSCINNRQNQTSDIDFAVYYKGSKKERFEFRLKILKELPNNFDINIFQDLPLFVRAEVLKGKLIYAKDKLFVYNIAYQTIKAFEDFKKYYYDYLKTRKLRI